MTDKKNIRPSYYNRGGIECNDVIVAWDLSFQAASTLKYLCRAGHKPDEKTGDLYDGHVRDLRKARTYIDLELKRIEQERQNAQTQEVELAEKPKKKVPPNGTTQEPPIKAPDKPAEGTMPWAPPPPRPEPPRPHAPSPEPQRVLAAPPPMHSGPGLLESSFADEGEAWLCDGCADEKLVRERYVHFGKHYCAMCARDVQR